MQTIDDPAPAPRTALRTRPATPDDIETVMRHRRCMFAEMGQDDPDCLRAMDASSRPLFARGLADGTYHGWLVEDEQGAVVAGGGIVFVPYHSSPRDPAATRAWIVNVYTEPAHRRRGLARAMMRLMIDWCRERGLTSIYLHASDEGRPLYEALGFAATSEMRLPLEATRTSRS